jgi:hypothetical protein
VCVWTCVDVCVCVCVCVWTSKMVRNLGAWNHHPTTTTNRLVLWLALLAYCRVAFHLSMARMLGSHGLLFFLVVAVSFLSFFPSFLLVFS